MELILGAVFLASSPSAFTRPNAKLIKSFQKQRSSVSKSDFEPGWSCVKIPSVLHNDRDNLLQFAYNQLSKQQDRDDYKEYLELSIIFLGGTVINFSFKRPGAMHYAPWMAKILNCLKIYIFHKQINDLDQNDIELVKIVNIFAVKVYLKPWFTACNAPSAHRADLTLLVQLRNHHHSIGRVAASKLKGHLWYLSPELVSLALFDDLVSPSTKRAMVQAGCKRKSTSPEKSKRH